MPDNVIFDFDGRIVTCSCGCGNFALISLEDYEEHLHDRDYNDFRIAVRHKSDEDHHDPDPEQWQSVFDKAIGIFVQIWHRKN